MRKIGVLGGTFDPPHFGHLLIAEEARQTCCLDEIWFMPSKIPPHKKISSLSTDDDRVEMVKRAIKNNPYFKLSLIEFERNGPSFTIDTMKELNRRYNNDKFFFIIGGDMVHYLPKWKDIHELMTLVTFIGINRPGFSISNNSNENVIMVEAPQLDISSSQIRQRIQQDQSVRYLLPEPVLDYIKENELYEQRQSTAISGTTIT